VSVALTLVILSAFSLVPATPARDWKGFDGQFLLQGTIIQVDPKTGALLLRDDWGRVWGRGIEEDWGRGFDSVVPPVLLNDLQPGDRVEVRGKGTYVTFVRKLPPLPQRPGGDVP